MDYAYEWDVVTGNGVGIRHAVWLKTTKPLHLRPDVWASECTRPIPQCFSHIYSLVMNQICRPY